MIKKPGFDRLFLWREWKELTSVITAEGNAKENGVIRKAVDGLVGLFLLANLLVRFSSIFHYPSYNKFIAILLGIVLAGCICVIVYRKFLGAFLFLFGFSFFLYGFGSFEIQSRVFEILVTCVASSIFVINWRSKDTVSLNGQLSGLLLCYIGLSLFSLFSLPLGQAMRDLSYFGYSDGLFYFFRDPPNGTFYPIVAVLRLVLFFVLVVQISRNVSRNELYGFLFSGVFSGAVFCAFIGLLDFYGVISLAWYRFGTVITPGVLHSTFLNRGWFAEFILTVVPFVLIGFMSTIKGIWWKIVLFSSLVICELALILAGARAGWVSYPLILFICWLFAYFSKKGRFESFHFGWKDLMKVAVSVPVTIVISFLLVFQVLMPLSGYLGEKKGGNKSVRNASQKSIAYFESQAARIVTVKEGGRYYTWGEGFNVGRECPLFGMGYESFNWHGEVLAGIAGSYFNNFLDSKKSDKIHQTPHSIFFQLFVSGGVVGLFLWMLIIAYALVLLIFDLVRNKRLLNIPVVISIISFHIYGIFQSMQYIPMIWLLIFLSLGYAMTIDGAVLPIRLKRVMGLLGKASVVLMVIGFFAYLSNFESRSLAQKYGMRIYAKDQDRDRFAGFFDLSNRKDWQYGDYRWFSKRAALKLDDGIKGQRSKVKGQRYSNRRIGLEFYCLTPGLEKEPVVLSVSYGGRVLDQIVFLGEPDRKKGKRKKKPGETVRRQYELPVVPGKERELLLEVSRTWIPHEHLKNFDRRKLGVSVKVIADRRQTKNGG
ncbi:O-antigen polymerase [delta proteobacterium NaphS2]|nr:O-antigen polymerase [delta proteobacterium NaphS2]